MKSYISTPTEDVLANYRTATDSVLKKSSENFVLGLFHEMAKGVPAYKDFLSGHGINAEKIGKIQDLQHVPLMDKPSYIDKYPLHMLCWHNTLKNSYMLSASSGSSGKAYFWPRSKYQTDEGTFISRLIYQEFFEMRNKQTLYIVAFAMGTWIAGSYMMMATLEVAKKGFPITVVTPGLNKDEIVRLCQMGKEEYDQVVLVGYPPFIKDTIDYGCTLGISWNDINIKFLFSGEAITEGWRSHLHNKVKFSSIYNSAINIYGSADVGLIAHETAVTTYLRRKVWQDGSMLNSLFKTNRVPAIYQYDPHIRYFEQMNEELIVSARSGIPLLRYNTRDIGNVMWFDESFPSVCCREEFDREVPGPLQWKLPMVYIFGREKFSASLYGITIYPEYIKYLLDLPNLERIFTGKFVLRTEETLAHDQLLHLHLELKEFCQPTEEIQILTLEEILRELPIISSEFRHLLGHIEERAHPQIKLHRYGDPEYFPIAVIKKTS